MRDRGTGRLVPVSKDPYHKFIQQGADLNKQKPIKAGSLLRSRSARDFGSSKYWALENEITSFQEKQGSVT